MLPVVVGVGVAVALWMLDSPASAGDGQTGEVDHVAECHPGEGVVTVIENDEKHAIVEVEHRDEDAVCSPSSGYEEVSDEPITKI